MYLTKNKNKLKVDQLKSEDDSLLSALEKRLFKVKRIEVKGILMI